MATLLRQLMFFCECYQLTNKKFNSCYTCIVHMNVHPALLKRRHLKYIRSLPVQKWGMITVLDNYLRLPEWNLIFPAARNLRQFSRKITHCRDFLIKGIASRVWERLQGIQVIDLKNLKLTEHIFIPFWCYFHVLIIKKHSVAVFHLAVTLQMMSNSRRSLCEWWVTAIDQHRWSLLTYR